MGRAVVVAARRAERSTRAQTMAARETRSMERGPRSPSGLAVRLGCHPDYLTCRRALAVQTLPASLPT